MKVNVKTRYGLRVMLNLALKYGKGPVFLSEIAKKENISKKFLGQIIIPLKAADLINSTRGAKGGYSLAISPAKITVKMIVVTLQGGLDFAQSTKNFPLDSKTFFCIKDLVWEKLQENISNTLKNITLEDLVCQYMKNEKNSLVYSI